MLVRFIHNDKTICTERFDHISEAISLFLQIENFLDRYIPGEDDHYTIQLIDYSNHIVMENTLHL